VLVSNSSVGANALTSNLKLPMASMFTVASNLKQSVASVFTRSSNSKPPIRAPVFTLANNSIKRVA